jgi:hypothetical protein
MATWKKVAVSGSGISQFNNDAGYLTSVTAQNAFVTMSINGINVIADNAVDTLTFASSSGAGLAITGDAGADSITFALGGIPNSSLTNSAVTVTAGNGLTGGGSISLGSSATVDVGAGTHITVNANDIAVNTGTLIPAVWAASGSYTGSIFTQVSGDIAITAAGVATIQANSVALGTDTTGNYAAAVSAGSGIIVGGTAGEGTTFTVSADSASMATYFRQDAYANVSGDITINSSGVAAIGTGVIVNNDVAAGAAIAASKINFGGTGIVSGSSIASGAQGEVTLTTNGVAGSTVDLGLQTTDSPQFVGLTLTGDAAVNGGDITTSATTFNLVNANATTVNFAGAATTLNLGNASGTTTIAGNAVVQGDFTVNGTTTYLNVTDLFVEDRFITLASGSATAGDGGIMIDRGSDAAGNIGYGFDSVTDRWGFQSGLTDSTNTFDPTSAGGVSGSFVGYVFTEANHGATKPITGEFAVQGAMYTSNAGDIWIYA